MTQSQRQSDIGDRFIAGARNHARMREELRLGVTTLAALYSEPLDELLRKKVSGTECAFHNEFGSWTVGVGVVWAITWNGHEVFLGKKVFGRVGYNEPARVFLSQMRQEFGVLVKGMMSVFPDHCVQISHILDAADLD